MHTMELVDTHAHLDFKHFKDDRHEVVERARKGGLRCIINISSDLTSCKNTVQLIQSYPGYIYGTVGLHPHNARYLDGQGLKLIASLAQEEGVVALGEMGLDYHYDNSPRDVQKRVFRAQLRLAREHRLPVVIHSRDADGDMITILREEGVEEIGGVMHCFSGTRETAEKALSMGLYLSFGGVLTFPKARDIQKIAQEIPRNRLLLETDCPYLTPVPHRGKRNEPLYVRYVAEAMAELRGEDPAEIAQITTENASRLFGLTL